MGVKDTSHADKPLTIDAKLAITTGHIKALHDRLLRDTGVAPVAIVLHPEYAPEYHFTSIFGLPIIRDERVPKTHPLLVWGHP